jgi:hypothetical protein
LESEETLYEQDELIRQVAVLTIDDNFTFAVEFGQPCTGLNIDGMAIARFIGVLVL